MNKSRMFILVLMLLSAFSFAATPALAAEPDATATDNGNSCSPDDSNCTGNPGAWADDGTPGWAEDGQPGWSEPSGSSSDGVVALLRVVVRLPLVLAIR